MAARLSHPPFCRGHLRPILSSLHHASTQLGPKVAPLYLLTPGTAGASPVANSEPIRLLQGSGSRESHPPRCGCGTHPRVGATVAGQPKVQQNLGIASGKRQIVGE